jgi:hypothetical protein
MASEHATKCLKRGIEIRQEMVEEEKEIEGALEVVDFELLLEYACIRIAELEFELEDANRKITQK